MRIAALTWVGVLLGGCNLLPGGGAAGPLPDLPGCDQSQEFAFIGETTLDQLGIGDFGPDAGRVGMVWVTADRVQIDMGPAPGGMPGAEEEPTRMVCVQWADGSGMSGPIADDWMPPAAAPAADGDSIPFEPIVLVAMLALLAAASVLAFRREPSG